MDYFTYQPNVTGDIWSLFKDLGSKPHAEIERTYSGSEYSHTLEIINAAMSSSIRLNDNFDLLAYERACQETDTLEKKKIKGHKEVNIVDFETSKDDSLTVGYGDISSRSLRAKEDLFDSMLDSEALNQNLEQLFNIRSRYIVEQGVDVVSVLYNAMKGVSDAMVSFKGLLHDSTIKDLYTELCLDSHNGELLRRLEVRMSAT